MVKKKFVFLDNLNPKEWTILENKISENLPIFYTVFR